MGLRVFTTQCEIKDTINHVQGTINIDCLITTSGSKNKIYVNWSIWQSQISENGPWNDIQVLPMTFLFQVLKILTEIEMSLRKLNQTNWVKTNNQRRDGKNFQFMLTL